MTLASRIYQELTEGMSKPLVWIGGARLLSGFVTRVVESWVMAHIQAAKLECMTPGEEARLDALSISMFGPRKHLMNQERSA